MSDPFGHEEGARRAIEEERGVQRKTEAAEARSFRRKSDGPMQAGARPYPVPPFAEQHQDKPGIEAELQPRPITTPPTTRARRS